MLSTLITFIQEVGNLFDALATTIPKVVTGSAILTALLPPPEHHGFLRHLHKLLNIFAFNLGEAKNHTQEKR